MVSWKKTTRTYVHNERVGECWRRPRLNSMLRSASAKVFDTWHFGQYQRKPVNTESYQTYHITYWYLEIGKVAGFFRCVLRISLHQGDWARPDACSYSHSALTIPYNYFSKFYFFHPSSLLDTYSLIAAWLKKFSIGEHNGFAATLNPVLETLSSPVSCPVTTLIKKRHTSSTSAISQSYKISLYLVTSLR